MKLNLNIHNGDVTIGDIKITSMFSIADIECLKSKYEIHFIWKNNSGYTFYQSSFLNGGENAILFIFGKHKICRLYIGPYLPDSPPYEITEEKKKKVKDILKALGGAHTYSWGAVFYNEDSKGGNVNVGFIYNNESLL
jgi:hypothetical protein